MTDRLNLTTPYLDAILHALIDPERTEFEIRHLDLGRDRSVWLAELRREIAGLSAQEVSMKLTKYRLDQDAQVRDPNGAAHVLQVRTSVYISADVDEGRPACADQPWQPIATLPARAWDAHGITCFVSDGVQIVMAYDCGVLPDGSICGSLPSHSGRITDWGITCWMPISALPAPPSPAAKD